MEQNSKDSEKHLRNKILLLSFIGFSLITIVLFILFFTVHWSWSMFTGLVIGYCFGLAGFFLIYVAGWALLTSQNKYLFFLLLIVRLVVYAIPVVIAAFLPAYFMLYTVIIGLCINPATTFFIQTKFPSIKKHNKNKQEESETGA